MKPKVNAKALGSPQLSKAMGLSGGLVDDEELGPVPPGVRPQTRVVSPDLRRVAVVATVGDQSRVHVNHEAGPAFDSIASRTLRLSTDGQTTVYVGLRDKLPTVIVNGQAWPIPGPIDAPAFASNPSLSGNGARVMVVYGLEGQKLVRMIDMHVGGWQDFGPYARVLQPQFGADNRGWFLALRDDRWHVVTDGVEDAGHQHAGLVALSPNGHRAAFTADVEGGDAFMVDGEPGAILGAFTGPFSFSADSSRYGYITSSADGPTRTVIDGEVLLGPSGGGRMSTVVFSADSRHVGHLVADPDGRVAFVIDGVLGPYFSNVSDLYLTSIEGHLRYAYARSTYPDMAVIETDRGALPKFPAALGPLGLVRSADGSRLAYLAARSPAKRGEAVVMLDGLRMTPKGQLASGEPVFARKGRWLAHLSMSTAGICRLILDSNIALTLDGMTTGHLIATEAGFAALVQSGQTWRRIELGVP